MQYMTKQTEASSTGIYTVEVNIFNIYTSTLQICSYLVP